MVSLRNATEEGAKPKSTVGTTRSPLDCFILRERF
jgi:hypothetical protein